MKTRTVTPAQWHLTDTFAVPVEVLYTDESTRQARVHSRDRYLWVALDELTFEDEAKL